MNRTFLKPWILVSLLALTFSGGAHASLLLAVNNTAIQSFDAQLYHVFNDRFYYVENNDTVFGREWFSHNLQENEEGELLIDIKPNAASGIPSALTEDDIFEINDTIYFLADDGTNGIELWYSLGEADTTELLFDLDSNDFEQVNINDRDPQQLRAFGDKIVFFAASQFTANEYDLWMVDGLETTLVKRDVGRLENTVPVDFVAGENQFYFVTFNDNKEYSLWVSDGTEIGTVNLETFPANVSIKDLTLLNGELYFIHDERSLYKTDGGENNSELVRTFLSDNTVTPSVFFLRAFNNQLIMAVRDNTQGRELWVSDGAAGGTEILQDINFGSNAGIADNFFTSSLKNRYTYELPVFQNRIYFPADDGSNGIELWRTDGTENGTELVANQVNGSGSSNPRNFVVFDSALYFIAEEEDGADFIYRINSDNLDEIEVVVGDLDNFSTRAQSIREIVEMAGSLYFIEETGSGITLWEMDLSGEDEDDGEINGLVDLWFGGASDPLVIGALLALLLIGRRKLLSRRK